MQELRKNDSLCRNILEIMVNCKDFLTGKLKGYLTF